MSESTPDQFASLSPYKRRRILGWLMAWEICPSAWNPAETSANTPAPPELNEVLIWADGGQPTPYVLHIAKHGAPLAESVYKELKCWAKEDGLI